MSFSRCSIGQGGCILHTHEPGEDEIVIYCKSFRHHRTGKRIYAHQYGKQAFRLVVKRRKPHNKPGESKDKPKSPKDE